MVLLVRTATSPKRRTMVPHTLVMRSSTAPMAAAIASLVALAAEDLSVPALREAGIEASPALLARSVVVFYTPGRRDFQPATPSFFFSSPE